MCIPGADPLSLAGVAASVGGSLVNAKMQNDAIAEQNRQNQLAMTRERDARTQETDRQRQMEAAQAEEVTRALSVARPQEVADRAQREVESPDNRVLQAAETYNAPSLQGQVQNEDVGIGGIIAGSAARTREMLRNAALLQAQQGGLTGADQGLFDMSSLLASIGSDRRGSMNAARLETSVPAATVSRSTSPIGDLLMLGGQGLAGYGGQRAGMATPANTIGKPLSAIPWLR